MAQRYGGKFSPVPGAEATDESGADSYRLKSRSRTGFRVNFLFVVPFLFVVSAFRSEALGLALNLGAFACLMLAAWLTRDGIVAEDAYDARRVARRPAIPRKMFASGVTGAGLALAGLGDGSLVNALVFGLLGAGLHSLAFGIDPLKDKGMSEGDRFQTDRVERAVREAEDYLKEMREAVARTRDRTLVTRVDRFEATARKMFRTVEDDPRDLTAARKFLGVYLLGARDAAVKFADLFTRKPDAQAKADFVALLDDLERNYAAKTETLLLDDRSNFDVEIEVLRERLERETR